MNKLNKLVKITSGAWTGEQGKIIGFIESNNAYRIKLDSGFVLAYFDGEFEIID